MRLSLPTIPSFLAEWPPYKVGLRADGEGVQREGHVELFNWAPALLLVASNADIIKWR